MDNINKVIEMLKGDKIIIYPTDTAFGIGCRIDNEKAVQKLFLIRNRPETKATPVLVSSIEMAKKYLKPLSKDVKNIMEKYWPGALTIVYKCVEEKVPALVRGGGKTLGVRMPNNPTLLKIIEKVGTPILGPSANLHGGKTPYSTNDLDVNLIKKVDFVLEGKSGYPGNISTVLDCTVKPYKILRQGTVFIKNNYYMNKILYINTSSNEKIVVALKTNGSEKKIESLIDKQKAQKILPTIDELLSKCNTKLEELTGIEVTTGPGSFTGLRVGIAVANSLSYTLKIPVNNKAIGDFEVPSYE